MGVKKWSFSLLEIMIALILILMASGIIGWNMQKSIRKKEFQTDLEKLKSRIFVCQHLATVMQADWKGVFRRQEHHWIFETTCDESLNIRQLSPIKLHSLDIFFNGKKFDTFTIEFFSSGKIVPDGLISFYQDRREEKSEKEEWKFPDLFHKEMGQDGKRLGPVHPDELKTK